MRRICDAIVLVAVSVATSHAQTALTEPQRIADLNQLASFYAKNYAPYEWKRDVFGFDLLRLNRGCRTSTCRTISIFKRC